MLIILNDIGFSNVNDELFQITAIILGLILIYILYLELVKPIPQVGTVDGSVTYSDQPVAGVTITLANSEGIVLFSTMSGEDGSFEFDEVAIGYYTVRAHKDMEEGFLEGESYIQIAGGDVVSVDLPLVN
jgi:hypothetical protein